MGSRQSWCFVAATLLSLSAWANPPNRIVDADREPQNWLSTGRSYDESRESPLTHEIKSTRLVCRRGDSGRGCGVFRP